MAARTAAQQDYVERQTEEQKQEHEHEHEHEEEEEVDEEEQELLFTMQDEAEIYSLIQSCGILNAMQFALHSFVRSGRLPHDGKSAAEIASVTGEQDFEFLARAIEQFGDKWNAELKGGTAAVAPADCTASKADGAGGGAGETKVVESVSQLSCAGLSSLSDALEAQWIDWPAQRQAVYHERRMRSARSSPQRAATAKSAGAASRGSSRKRPSRVTSAGPQRRKYSQQQQQQHRRKASPSSSARRRNSKSRAKSAGAQRTNGAAAAAQSQVARRLAFGAHHQVRQQRRWA
jgi:hypothetical protein